MKALNKNVSILMLAGAFGLCVAPMVVFIGGLVGHQLAPSAALATLPVAFLVIGTAAAVVPVARAMQRFGRKRVFIANALIACLSALLTAWAVSVASFWVFVLGVALLGASLAAIQQFRFAAMASVAPDKAANAASLVLLGGLIAAFLGPELAHMGKALLAADFSGSFALLALASLTSALLLLLYKETESSVSERQQQASRSLSELLAQPLLWVAISAAGVGYAVMSYVMTATPLSMHALSGHSLAETKWVIQSHIAAMFLPSFFSGQLINRFGPIKLIIAGLLIYVACLVAGLLGQDVMHYGIALVLLGIGWNFLFVSGTALLPQTYQHHEQYKVQGLNDFVVFGFQAIASLSSGLVIHQFGWNALLVMAFPLLLLLVLSLGAWRRSEQTVATV